MNRIVATAASAAVLVVGVAAPGNAVVERSSKLAIQVKYLHWPCHTDYLVGTFTVTGLNKGAFQVDASTEGYLLIHGAKAKKAGKAELKNVKLKYPFPKGEPSPGGTYNVYVSQGERQPSETKLATISKCSG